MRISKFNHEVYYDPTTYRAFKNIDNVYKIDLFTGMRQGEILGLTWDCVDFDSGIITIEKQLQREHIKGGRHMLVSNKNVRVRKIMPAPFVMDILKQ